jgi:hypothetical protein
MELLLGRILRFRHSLEEDCRYDNVLARAEPLWELHAGVIANVVIDRLRALPGASPGVPSLWLGMRP